MYAILNERSATRCWAKRNQCYNDIAIPYHLKVKINLLDISDSKLNLGTSVMDCSPIVFFR
jgi:hypothetical protein